MLHRTFQLAGAPFVLPPGTPKERVEILQEAMRPFKDSEFLKEYKKTGDDSPPLMPEALDKIVKGLPAIRRSSSCSNKYLARDHCHRAKVLLKPTKRCVQAAQRAQRQGAVVRVRDTYSSSTSTRNGRVQRSI